MCTRCSVLVAVFVYATFDNLITSLENVFSILPNLNHAFATSFANNISRIGAALDFLVETTLGLVVLSFAFRAAWN